MLICDYCNFLIYNIFYTESSDNNTKSGLWIEFAHLELKKGAEGTRK